MYELTKAAACRRLQFRLKSVFALVLLVAAFFGGIRFERRETERVRRELEQTRDEALIVSTVPADAFGPGFQHQAALACRAA